jgi:hypothetical protein
LVRWFREASSDDLPVRTHSRDTDAGGVPDWHASFRAWLTAHPTAVDREGHVRSPFRFHLWVMSRGGWSGRVRAQFLYRLAVLDGDWLAAVRVAQMLTEDGEVMARDFATETLRQFWRRMQSEPRREVGGPKSESQHRAEEAS